MKKCKLLILLLCLCMITGLFSQMTIVSFASEIYASGDFEYRINRNNKTATLTNYLGSNEKVIVPKTIDGCIVTDIGMFAFYNLEEVTSVSLPDTITLINFSAFANCGITEIEIPENVSIIDPTAFNNCKNLEKITVDKKNKKYSSDEDGVLFCNNQTLLVKYPEARSNYKYTVPLNVIYIGPYAFAGCNKLYEVTISDNVSVIFKYAFANCASLYKVVVSEIIISIEDGAFDTCEKLREVIFKGNAPKLNEQSKPVFNNVPGNLTLYYTDEEGFADETWGKYDKVKIIVSGEDYFKYSISGKKVTITEYLGEAKNVIIPEKIDGYPVTKIGEASFSSNKSMESVMIPETVTSIDSGAFYSCENLKSIFIPDSVKSIGNSVLQWCPNLESVTISSRLTEIGSAMFYGCEKLTNVIIPDNIKKINSFAFYGCTNLKSIIIPNKVSAIDFNAFGSCENLESIYFKGNAPKIDDGNIFIKSNPDLIIYYIKGKLGWTDSYWKDSKLEVYNP